MDGSFKILFSAEEGYTKYVKTIFGDQLELPTEEVISTERWIPLIKEKFSQVLSKKRATSQEERASLLDTLTKVMALHMPKAQAFFLADYTTDRKDMLTSLSQKANPEYVCQEIYLYS